MAPSFVMNPTRVDELSDFEPSGEWEGRQTELEASLEGWVEKVTRSDRARGVRIALVACELAHPIAEVIYAESGLDYGGPNDLWGDMLSPPDQMAAVRAWLVDEDPDTLKRVVDYTRQLNVWDEDLRPSTESPEGWYVYFVEATNLLAMAAKHDDEGPYGTPGASVAAARATVCAFKSMWRTDVERRADAQRILDAL